MELAFDWLKSLQQRSSSVGIDVGQRSVKGIQLSKSGSSIRLDNAFILDQAELEGDRERVTHLRDNLSAVVEVKGLTDSKVIACGGAGQVQMMDLTLPPMPEAELKLVIEKNLEENLNRPVSELTYDFEVVKQGRQHIVRIYHAELNEVTRLLDDLLAAQLKPMAMNASFLAVAEMLQFNGYTTANTAKVVVDLGESSISTSLVLNSEVIANHVNDVGVGVLNFILMDSKGYTLEESENAIRQARDPKRARDNEIAMAVDEAYISLLESAQLTIDYYRGQELGVPVDEILLTGGGCLYSSVAQILEDHNQIPTKVVNPFRNILTITGGSDGELSPDQVQQMAPFMSAAVGLALGGLNW